MTSERARGRVRGPERGLKRRRLHTGVRRGLRLGRRAPVESIRRGWRGQSSYRNAAAPSGEIFRMAEMREGRLFLQERPALQALRQRDGLMAGRKGEGRRREGSPEGSPGHDSGHSDGIIGFRVNLPRKNLKYDLRAAPRQRRLH
jgi:hypothetical protein